MKAKLLLSVTFLCSFFGTAFSQGYHPFLNNSSWLVNDLVSCCRPPEVRTIEEGTNVIIGSYTYTQFNDPFPEQDSHGDITVVSIREDVAQKKVYKLVNGTDVLLYDFSLENGDTVSQHGFTFAATVDEITVNEGTRKRITLRSTEPYNGETLKQIWIEGVGTVAHPFYPERNMYSVVSSGGGVQIKTRCSFQNGAHVFGNANCAPAPAALSTAIPSYSNRQVVFSPNPFVSQLDINSESALQNASFKLFNAQGQLVREINNLNGKKITLNRENLNSGLYLAQLFENNKLVKTDKIIID